jgi:hypothetical protein
VRINPPGLSYPCWNGLEAEKILKIDVDNGKHNEMLPEVLRLANLAYEEFPLKIFRNHIHQ